MLRSILAMGFVAVTLVGCGNSASESGGPVKAPVVDANGVETRANGTTIERAQNGDK